MSTYNYSLTQISKQQCQRKAILFKLASVTYSNVLIGGLPAVEVVLREELGQLRLDAPERLVLTVEQHHQV